MTDAKPGLKAKALREFRRFATMFAYLWVMFFLLQLHQYVILAQRDIPFEQYGARRNKTKSFFYICQSL